MTVALRVPAMTRDEFLLWLEAQDGRHEFDGVQPVAMVNNTRTHGRISQNLFFALRSRLGQGPCEVLGPDAGVATIGSAVRFPDALVTCTPGPGTDRIIPGAVVVFEIVSSTSGYTDRIVKLREYAAAPSIRRYVILESAQAGLTLYERADPGAPWTATGLLAEDTLDLPEIGVAIPVAELYEGVDLAAA